MNQPNQSVLTGTDILKLKHYLITTISGELNTEGLQIEQQDEFLRKHLNVIYERAHLQLPESIREQLFRELKDELFGYGPI